MMHRELTAVIVCIAFDVSVGTILFLWTILQMMHRFLCGSLSFLLIFCGTTARMDSGKRGLQHHLVQFTNKDMYFQASSVEATFRDGSNDMFWVAIQYNLTIIGDYLQFTTTTPLEREVVFLSLLHSTGNKMKPISGNAIKLGCQMTTMDGSFGTWMCIIDSEIQLSSSNQVFQCNHVEFLLWKNAPKGMFDGNRGKLVLKNVKMAAFFSSLTTTQWRISHNIYSLFGDVSSY
jgi:hypothetical protein